MEIYDLLREDHAAMLAQLRQLASHAQNGAGLDALRSRFEFHDLFEREVLYPAMAVAPGGAGATEQARDDHAEIDRLLAELGEPLAGAVAEDLPMLEWRERVSALIRVLAAHITREEGPWFDLAHGSISAADAAEMAEKYCAAKRQLLGD
jgi:hypothetical protein